MTPTYMLGIDVGSTTVKCVLVNTDTLQIIFKTYLRHETKQAEVLLSILHSLEQSLPDECQQVSLAFITGSGAGPLAKPLGARFVQEVNAVTLAVERLHPDVNSVIELGGQDAKVILFKGQADNGQRSIITSMNDKCASGTGATIDKCILKVGLSHDVLLKQQFDSSKLHHVAAKCGVFAETDIVNLIKAGVPSDEIMNSLADAIVMQNLTVLTRGNTVQPNVLLLGGPNRFLPFLQSCWRYRIAELWEERDIQFSELELDKLVFVPENAEYYAAFGAVIFGMGEAESQTRYQGSQGLQQFISSDNTQQIMQVSVAGLLSKQDNLEEFRQRYSVPTFTPPQMKGIVPAYLGIDGGSTSSKAVLMGEDGQLLVKAYQISHGNPIQDAKELLADIRRQEHDLGCQFDIRGMGVTGYAADVLEGALETDVNIVETIAHMHSAQHYFGDDIDVICDIGGQDIKVMFLQNGAMKNFRLSNQCSAGNGMLLQAMASQFGVKMEDFADIAFSAQMAPQFTYGCAVFLDTDRVNFQKEGFSREQLFAGLAQVLPKNVWQYVVQAPRLAEFGNKFVLQGGTQFNLAAVKAQVDYIRSRVPNGDVHVHPYCGEAGAIGAALEAQRVVTQRGHSTFVGMENAINISFTTRTDEETRCTFCENNCSRTFIDTKTPQGKSIRYIAGFSCEKGTVESKEAVVELNKKRRQLKAQYPNMVDYESESLFRHKFNPEAIPTSDNIINDQLVTSTLWGWGPIKRKSIKRHLQRSSSDSQNMRGSVRIGIPRVLNNYSMAPFLRTYLETLGVSTRNIIFSDFSNEDMFLEGAKYGSIDPCYPSKVCQAHIHHLLFHHKFERKPLNYIWFPSVTEIPSYVKHTMGNTACPIVAGTPKVVHAAFTKERDIFAMANVDYVDNVLNFENQELLKAQLFSSWKDRLKITEDESNWACEQAWHIMDEHDAELQKSGKEILETAVAQNSVVILLLGRPYHSDPGLNHEVLEEFQALGYPVLSMRSIPKDEAFLKPFFQQDLERGYIEDVYDIRDVWPENFSINSAQKVWAAKFAARHPNIAVLDLSSFKCGHDAPTYNIIDQILGQSKTPHLTLHDVDANKPDGSIRIRVKTYAYSLQRHQEQLEVKNALKPLSSMTTNRNSDVQLKQRVSLTN